MLEEVGKIVKEGGAGVTISSQSGWRMSALITEKDELLAVTPIEKLLSLPMLRTENIRDTLHAYQMAKRWNEKRVIAESVKCGRTADRVCGRLYHRLYHFDRRRRHCQLLLRAAEAGGISGFAGLRKSGRPKEAISNGKDGNRLMKRRKLGAFLLLAPVLAVILSGCGNGRTQPEEERERHDAAEENIGLRETERGSAENVVYDVPESEVRPQGSSAVYMTTDISPEGLKAVYEALGWTPEGSVAVKLSTGEPPASNYLRPELIGDLVRAVDGIIVECNTAYGGSRAETAMHYQVAEDHGFTAIADFRILDEDGSMILPVTGGRRLTENYVGAAFADYDSYLILSHFKGHAMAGFGGAVKNISIGLGSSEGKSWIHSGGTSLTSPWGGEQDAFLESMAEAGKSVSDYLGDGERIVYINVMNRLSVDCDCDGNPAEPDMHDVGILASSDPVALDQACIDLIYEQADGDGASLVERIESRNGLHTLEHAEEIGLGSRTYELISLDE